MPRLAFRVFALLLFLCASSAARAQQAFDVDQGRPFDSAQARPETSGDAPAHISVIDGAVVLERDGRTESTPTSMPLLAGDRVRSQNGRAEIVFGDGSTLYLDTDTLVDFQSDEVIRLLEGRIRLNIVGPPRRVDYLSLIHISEPTRPY